MAAAMQAFTKLPMPSGPMNAGIDKRPGEINA